MKRLALFAAVMVTLLFGSVLAEPLPRQVVAGNLFVSPVGPVAVAPGQPAVGSAEAATPDSQGQRTASPTAGIINAVCSVTLNIVGCGFFPTSVTLDCDSDGDGVEDITLPLTDITVVNRLLLRATLPALSSQLPGSPFPIQCCGGPATLRLSRTVGLITQTLSTQIDLGLRAPVVLSVTPSTGDCATPQNLLISGACFTMPDGSANVTSVFAVERTNPNNVVRAARFAILSRNLLDADFDFGAANAGKSFLFHASGPNGTSRNLTSLPPGAGSTCPLGNEAGIQVLFTCNAPPPAPRNVAVVTGCVLERTESGSFLLIVTGQNIQEGATVTINGRPPKKLRFVQRDSASSAFQSVQMKGRICSLLPGLIVITNPGGEPSEPFQCNSSCE